MLSFWQPGTPAREHSRALADVAHLYATPLLVYEGPRIDLVHPTAEGYARFATRIADRLVAEGYVR